MLIKNTSTADVVNYNVNGEQFTILAGSTVDFPAGVAEYLMKIYSWIRTAETADAPKVQEVKPVTVTDIVNTPVVESSTPPNKKYTREQLEAMTFKQLQPLYKEEFKKGKILSKENYIIELLTI